MVTETVIEAVRRTFAGAEERAAVETLARYAGAEHERVRLAALLLARGDVEKLRDDVDVARNEYRDVLSWAEYADE